MKRILAFGDSNTWGYDPATKERYDKDIRWTGLLQNALGDDALILEEGLCGRTTVFDDANRAGRNGFAALPSILKAVEPIDTAIIMLGTNDCKSVFGASAGVIAAGMEKCIAKLTEYVKPENILLISPFYLGEAALNFGNDVQSLAVSRELKDAYKALSDKYGAAFLAASDITEASKVDGQHLTAEGHHALSKAVLKVMNNIL